MWRELGGRTSREGDSCAGCWDVLTQGVQIIRRVDGSCRIVMRCSDGRESAGKRTRRGVMRGPSIARLLLGSTWFTDHARTFARPKPRCSGAVSKM